MVTLIGVLREDRDGAVATFDRAFRTGAAELWSALTEPDRLQKWFAEVEGDLREGGQFTLTFANGDVEHCHLIECAPQHELAFEWPNPRKSLVTVKVVPDGKNARLELRHERLTRENAPKVAAVWDAYFHGLESHLAGHSAGQHWGQFSKIKAAYRQQLPL